MKQLTDATLSTEQYIQVIKKAFETKDKDGFASLMATFDVNNCKIPIDKNSFTNKDVINYILGILREINEADIPSKEEHQFKYYSINTTSFENGFGILETVER